jgi:two-component system NtrC family sensor kinase
MIHNSTKKHALAGLLMVALLGALVFLFMRAVTIDMRGDAHALSLLRELKDFDAKRDVDALRITADFEASAPASDWSALRARALRELERDPARAAVAAQLAAIRSAMAEKEAAYQTLRAAHADTLEALKPADDALIALSTGASAARLRDPALAASLAAAIVRIRASLRETNIERAIETGRDLAGRAAALRPAAASADPFLATAAAEAESAVEAFITARSAEAVAWRKFAYTTAGGRIDLASQAASRALDRALDERERWLVYLLAYATAFAIGVGYMGTRSFATQRMLRIANAELESRSSQRSRDLATTQRLLHEAEAQLVQSQKMSSLGQLLSGAAHEIDRPLGFVRERLSSARSALPDLRAAHDRAGRLVGLLRPGPADARQVEAAADALAESLRELQAGNSLDALESLGWDGLKAIEEAVELVGRLRQFSRLDGAQVASFNVNDGVHATLLMARPLLRKVDVEKTLGDVPAITCSPSQVNQVLLNLVTNAAGAIDKPRGRITVTTRAAKDSVEIEVGDNGIGIASEALPKIFDQGLGLSVARRIVSRHGGRIDVRSQVGVGSTFTVTLPLRPPEELVPQASARGVAA